MARAKKKDPLLAVTDAFYWLRKDYTNNSYGVSMSYNSVQPTRYRSTPPGIYSMGSGADYHYRSEADYFKIIETARYLDRNDMIVGAAIDKLIGNTLRTGITLDSHTGDEKVSRYIEQKWLDYSSDKRQVDSEGKADIHGLARIILRAMIVDGDVFTVPLGDGRVQIIEAHLCRTPIKKQSKNMILGVLIDGDHRPIEYSFCRDSSPSFVPKPEDSFVVKAENAWHLFEPKRAAQTRGVSAFVPVLDAARMHGDIQQAMLIKQQISACYALLRERPASTDSVVTGITDNDLSTSATDSILEENGFDIMQPGQEFIGAPGERLSGFSPNIPSQEYFSHVSLILQIIGTNFGVPAMVLLLDPRQGNFSSYRGIMEQAKIGFECKQQMIARSFYRELFLERMREWSVTDKVIASAIASGIDVLSHSWNTPYFPYIDPQKDASADSLIVDACLDSRRHRLAIRGLDVARVDSQIVTDGERLIAMALSAAARLNSDYNASVTWRDVIAPWRTGGVKATSLDSVGGITNTETNDAEETINED